MAIAIRYRNLYPDRMKTTLDLNDTLLTEAKTLAAHRRTTLTRVIEEALQLRLHAQEAPRKRVRTRLPVFHAKGGLRPGIDPRSNASLMQAADGDDA